MLITVSSIISLSIFHVVLLFKSSNCSSNLDYFKKAICQVPFFLFPFYFFLFFLYFFLFLYISSKEVLSETMLYVRMNTQKLNGDSNRDGSKRTRVIPAVPQEYCTLNPAQVVFEATTFFIPLGKKKNCFKRYFILLTLFHSVFYPLRTLSISLSLYITS